MAGLVPAIHDFVSSRVRQENVDARDKRGHDSEDRGPISAGRAL